MKTVSTNKNQNAVFETLATLVSALGSKARLKILYLLAQAPRSVDALATLTGETVANTSQHLQRLLHQGLVLITKDKLSHIYRVSNTNVALMIENLFDLAESTSPAHVQAQKNLSSVNTTQPTTLFSVVESVQKKKALLLDVRESYETSHTPVPGSLSLPLSELKKKAKDLSKNKTYYLFCRGRACVDANEGVNILRSLGFKAYRLKESPSTLQNKMGGTL